MISVAAQSLSAYAPGQLALLEEVSKPLWLYSCGLRRSVWANAAALHFFGTTLEHFCQQDFGQLPEGHVTPQEYSSFQTLNELLKEEVEAGGREQVLEGFGWKMLPGVYPTGKQLNMDVSYKPLHLAQDGQIATHCLVQVIRGQEVHVVRGDASRASRIYRGRSNSLHAEGAADAQTPIGIMLSVLEDILNGQDTDVECVQELHKLIVSGEFLSVQSRMAEQLVAREQGLSKEVGENLKQLLGGQSDVLGKRRRSSAGSVDSDDSTLSGRLQRSCPRQLLGEQAPCNNGLLDGGLEEDGAEHAWDQQLALGHPGAAPVAAVEEALRLADGWHFDAFRLAEATGGHALSTLAFWLLQQGGVVREQGLDALRLARFLRRVEEGYNENPYHNRTHAADVLQSMHMLLTTGGLAGMLNNDLVLLAGYLAAAVHDLDHLGLNNDFLVRTGHELAVLYNDLSPLENHHLAGAWKLLQRRECNFLKRVAKDKQTKLRKMVIEMVLATDMKQHCGILSRFQSKMQVKIHTVSMSAGRPPGADDVPLSFDDEADRALLLQVGLKCADVGHLSAPWPVHQRWVSCLEEEVFRQGDQEKRVRLPVSPLMDRSKDGITKSQVGFFDLVAVPLFRSWASVFEGASPMLRAAEANRQQWKALEAARTA